MNDTQQFINAYPHVELACGSGVHGPLEFFEKFGIDWKQLDGFVPLLLASNYSCGGEMAQTYGLFKKDNELYEVHGTECSVWDFNGQWDLEHTTVESILHRIEKGQLGQGEHSEQNFYSELLEIVQKEQTAHSAPKIKMI